MYLREALLRCSKLLSQVANVYLALAEIAASPAVASCRRQSSRKETGLARLLFALAELSTAVDDDGPCLPDLASRLSRLTRALEEIDRRLSSATDPETDQACVAALEAAGLEELHVDLLEAAEPEMSRVLRLMDSQICHSRRALHEAHAHATDGEHAA